MISLAIFTILVVLAFLLSIAFWKYTVRKKNQRAKDKIVNEKHQILRYDEEAIVGCKDLILSGESVGEAAQRLSLQRSRLFPKSPSDPPGQWTNSQLEKHFTEARQQLSRKHSQRDALFVCVSLAIAVAIGSIGNLVGYQQLSKSRTSDPSSNAISDQQTFIDSEDEWVAADDSTFDHPDEFGSTSDDSGEFEQAKD